MPLAQYTNQRKPVFLYATGTAFISTILTANQDLRNLFGISVDNVPIKGLNGQTSYFAGAKITGDPFWTMLDPAKWDARKIGYPASAGGMRASINDGITKTVTEINNLPSGTPFALGGYSQGAAVMSLVMKNHLQTYTGNLGLPNITSRMADYRAAVMFGNPCRKTDSLWSAFRSYSGGLYSVSPDAPTLTRNGGSHGCFPAADRLTTVPDRWMEFVGGTSNAVDIVAGCGDGDIGTKFSQGAGILVDLGLAVTAVTWLASYLGINADLRTALETVNNNYGPVGHLAYPLFPPPGYPTNGPTSYQIALEFLDMVGTEIGVSPSVLPRLTGGTNGGTTRAGRPAYRPYTSTAVLGTPPVGVRQTPLNPNGSAIGATA